ncbi:MAG TPA: LCP family protein [Candidatus Saccharimonadales bacterium]
MEKERFKRRIDVRVHGPENSPGRPDNSLRYQLPRRDYSTLNPVQTNTQTVQIEPQVQASYQPPTAQEPITDQTATNTQYSESVPTSPSNIIDLSLPGGASDFRSTFKFKRPIIPLLKTWSFRFASVAMVLTLLAGGLFFTQSYMNLHKVLRGGSKTVAALQTNVNPNQLKGEGDGRINILLMGRGGGNHDGPDLTDTMMLASIDPVNHDVTLISIPRDLWVDVPNQGAMKINTAWETGEFKYLHKIAPGSTDPNAISAGYTEADQVVESVLGVNIDYNMIADFSAFQQAVNTLGGITINVPTELYDPTMAWQNNNSPILAQPGLQTFSGAQALNYVRSRETTSDFARAQRQRSMMVAIKQKAETLGVISNPLKIAGLFKAFSSNVNTDIGLSDANKLYSIVKSVDSSKILSVGLADKPNNYIKTGSLNGQSIDIPSAGMFNYSAIQNFVRGQLTDPYIVKENAGILVINGTTEPGLATSTAATLKSYGYNITNTIDTPTNNYNQTIVVDLSHGKDKYTKNYLQQRFNTTAVTSLPDNTIQTNGASFVIILGNDETVNSQG